MRKNFEQPNMMVVRMNNNVIATSDLGYGKYVLTGTKGDAADRLGREDYDWDAGY